MTDHELLNHYAADGSDEAFRDLVRRHLGLVRGVAYRHLGNVHQADEVGQAVFIALARKAASLPQGTVIAGWLYRAARFAAAKYARDEGRRTRREKEAAMAHAESVSAEDHEHVWLEIAPHLPAALEDLTPKDRDAVLLRFFENRSFAEVGNELGATEAAAKMRVGRALEKLRAFFRGRGVVVGSLVLTGTLAAKSAEVIPESLAGSVAWHRVPGPQTALADSILRHLALARLKFWVAWILAILGFCAAVGIAGYQWGWFGPRAAPPGWPSPAVPAQPWPGR